MIRAAALALLLLAPGLALAQAPARPAAAPEKPATPEKPLGLRLETTVTLRGPVGRWGTPVIDDLNRRLYLPRGPGGLTVLALDGFKVLAEVADTAGSAAVALDPETLRGFSANALETRPDGPVATAITAFDQRGFKPAGSIALAGVRHLLVDTATRQLVAAAEDGTLTLIDPAKLTVTKTLALEGKRISGLAADRRGRVFAALADRDSIAVVNMVTRELATTWKPEGCRQPAAMAFEAIGMRLVVVCRGNRGDGPPAPEVAMVLDPLTGRAVGKLAVPQGTDSVIHDAAQRQLYFASSIIASVAAYRQPDPFSYTAGETAGTRPLAAYGAADGRSGRLFLATAEYLATSPKPDGSGGGLRLLPNSFTLLVMKRLPLE